MMSLCKVTNKCLNMEAINQLNKKGKGILLENALFFEFIFNY